MRVPGLGFGSVGFGIWVQGVGLWFRVRAGYALGFVPDPLARNKGLIRLYWLYSFICAAFRVCVSRV